MSTLKLVEASLRSGQQSLLVSRLQRKHLVPVIQLLDPCGFAALDVFGGSTFESQLRFLGEDPFEVLQAVRKAAPTTPLLAFLGGQFLVGHRHLADDVVDAFISEAATAGIDIFRVYDPLNDVRNIERCARAIKKAHKKFEGTLIYSESPAYTTKNFIDKGKRLKKLGADRLCIYDPLGQLGAGAVAELVKGLNKATKLPITVHSSALTGQSGLTYFAAVEAGAQQLDVALSPLSGGTSLPSTEAIVQALQDTKHDVKMDIALINTASQQLENELKNYGEIADNLSDRSSTTAARAHLHPDTMLFLLSALQERNATEQLAAVEQELIRVRAELGYPPMVTPVAEIVAMQAVYNVCDGDRYAIISQEVRDYCLGLYGDPPAQIDKDVRREVIGNEKPITRRPADLLKPAMDKAKQQMQSEGLETKSTAAVVTYAMFPEEYTKVVNGEIVSELLISSDTDSASSQVPTTSEQNADSKTAANVREMTVEVDGEAYTVRVFGAGQGAVSASGASGVPAKPVINEGTLTAPLQGVVVKLLVAAGDKVEKAQTLVVLEAMKMQNEIAANKAGVVSAIYVAVGDVLIAQDAILQVD